VCPDRDPPAEDVEAVIRRLTEEAREGRSDRVRAELALAYGRRVQGSREENLQRILAYTDSLELSGEDADLWAATRVLRAKAYRDRSSTGGLGEVDLVAALYFFRAALEHYDEGTSHWAEVQLEIGQTLMLSPDYWPGAGEHLENARAFYRGTRAKADLAIVYERLGEWQARATLETGSPDLRRRALENFSLALANTDRAEDPGHWARVQLALGRLVESGGGGHESIVARHFEDAVETLSAVDHPIARLQALEQLASFLLRQGRWADALPHYDEALGLALDSARRPGTVRGQRAAAVGLSELAHCLAYCHLREGRFDQAVLTLESGRARLLLERLAWDSAWEAPSDSPGHGRLRQLRREIRTLESAQYGGMTFLEDSDRLESLREELSRVLAELGWSAAEPAIEQLAPDERGTVLVVPLVCPAGSALFILGAGDRHVEPDNVLDFPDVTTQDVDRWLDGDDADPGWFGAYRARDGDADQWRATLLGVSTGLGQLLAGPLAVRLRELGITRVVLVPAAGLQFLPVHAAVIDEVPSRHLLDEFVIEHVPSAAVRRVLRDRDRGRRRRPTGGALVAGVSEYPSLPPLPSVPDELELVGSLLGTAPLLDGAASPARVLAGLADANLVHLACHGAGWALAGNAFRLAWSPPPVLHLGESGLSFQDILLTDLSEVRLVCLSACDTGLVEHTLPWDEFEGLVTVFLQAGAPAVVSTLWAVDDRSTTLLMQRFYENLRRHDDPADALRRAQLWLRDSTRSELAARYEREVARGRDRFLEPYTELMLGGAPDDRPYAHPAYWAPFTFTGVGA
jgi:CHAT domain-containing protein